MMAGGFWNQLTTLNRNLSVNQKLSILALGTVILFGLLGFVYLLRQDDYQLLASNLSATDANNVVVRLKQLNIPCQITQGGQAVLVPSEQINRARLEVAAQGLNDSGRIGFEIFDKSNWSITDFAEKVNYRRALEGELERTILGISEISQARVHLVLEKDSLFADDKQPAKASVMVKLRTGATLPKRSVNGIRNLVAYAVEGLKADNVTVVDVHGNLLTQPLSDDSRLDQVQLSTRKRIENELAQKVVQILEPLVGKGKVRATTSVLLDYSQTQQKEEIFDPNGSVVLSQQKSAEKMAGLGASGGIPGTASNEGGNVAAKPADKGTSRESEVVNYVVSKKERQTILPRGEIKRVSMAVVVDDKSVSTTDPQGQTVEKSEPRDPDEMQRLRKLVSATIGFNADRGDQLTLENFPFSKVTQQEQVLENPGFMDRYQFLIRPAMRYLIILAVFLAFYLFIFKPVKNKVFSFVEFSEPEYAQLAAATNDPEMIRQLEEKMARLKGKTASLPGAAMGEGSELKQQLVELARQNPTAVSGLIRSWLSEGT